MSSSLLLVLTKPSDSLSWGNNSLTYRDKEAFQVKLLFVASPLVLLPDISTRGGKVQVQQRRRTLLWLPYCHWAFQLISYGNVARITSCCLGTPTPSMEGMSLHKLFSLITLGVMRCLVWLTSVVNWETKYPVVLLSPGLTNQLLLFQLLETSVGGILYYFHDL